MASLTMVASSSMLNSIAAPSSRWVPSKYSLRLPSPDALHFRSHQFALSLRNSRSSLRTRLADQETVITQQGDEQVAATQEEAEAITAVSVPVSPSDTLTMYFQAEGTMNELAIPAVNKGLEGIEGIADLKVQVVEGIASVQLTKQTTVQATGVASSLVELIQGSGFKLQTLNLSFEDEEDLVAN